MTNKYSVIDDKCFIQVVQRNGTVHTIIIDVTDIPLLVGHTIGVQIGKKHTYAITNCACTKDYLHRYLLDLNSSDKICVDHDNGNTLDNTRINLILATHAENNKNLHGLSTRNTSGVRGVHWCKTANKWQAQLCIDRKQHNLGLFPTIAEAEQALVDFKATL